MSNKSSWGLLLLVVVIVVVAGFMFSNYQGGGVLVNSDSELTGRYQAVFLINNQVYFGKLVNADAQYAVLTDIYYLQINQQIQPIEEGQEVPANPNISLVKLGGELHGPEDKMLINKDQILLIENLRDDSNVVQAIEQYKEAQAAGQ